MSSSGSNDGTAKNEGRDARLGEAAPESSWDGIDRRAPGSAALDDPGEGESDVTPRRRQVVRLRPTREAARIARLRASMPVATSEDGSDALVSQLREATLPAYFTEEERKNLSAKARLEREQFEQAKAERERLARLRAEEAKTEEQRAERDKARKAREENEKLQREEAEQSRLFATRRALAESANRDGPGGVDSLLPMLREGPVPPAPVVDPKQIAKLERAERLRAKRAQARREQAEQEREKQEQAERERVARELEKLEKARQEEAQLALAEFERVEAARLKAEKAERERIQAEREELERAELDRARAEKAELERIELDRARRAQAEREANELDRARVEQQELAAAELVLAQSEPLAIESLERAEPETFQFERAASEQEAGSIASEGAPLGDLAAAAAAEPGRRRLQAVGMVLLVLILVAATLYLSRARLFRATTLGPGDRLMVAAIDNRTGDPQLDGALTEAIAFELRESPNLNLLGSGAYRSAARQLLGGAEHPATPVLARQAAEAAGARSYLCGSLSSAGTGYILRADVLNVEDNRRLVEVEETAANRGQIAGAVERVATQLRLTLVSDPGLHVGPGGDPAWRSDVPLDREATGNLDALHQYSVGEAAEADGRINDALAAFQSATSLDPRFIQAQIRLSWIYREQHLAKESAQAARLAAQAAGQASERTRLLAQSDYEANATGNLDQAADAIRRFVALYPHDAEGARELARVLRLKERAE